MRDLESSGSEPQRDSYLAEVVTELRELASAERVARDRSERLGRITAALVQAVTPADVQGVVMDLVLAMMRETLGAAVGSMSLLSADGKTVETVACVGELDPAAFDPYRRVPIDAAVAAAEAIRSGQLVLIESAEEHARRYPSVASKPVYAGGTRGAIPLAVGRRMIGSINFGFPDWRRLTEDERSFMLAAARQCALALERTRLYESENQARAAAEASQRETDLLLQLSDAVNRAETLDEVYGPALDCVLAALRVDRASVLLYDPDRVMRFKAWRGLSDEYRKAVEGHSPWSPDDPDPQTVLVPDVTADEGLAPYGELFRKEGLGALGFVPLVHGRRLLGKFMVYCDAPRVFSDRDRELARTIAAQIAQAVARARLLEAERFARERLRRLQDVTARLSEAVTQADVARVLVEEGIAATDASTAGLWLLDLEDRVAELVHSEGYTEQGRKGYHSIELDGHAKSPVCDSLRAGEAVWVPSRAELVSRYPELAAFAAPPPGYRVASLPLRADGETVAALGFTFEVDRPFDPEERDFLFNIARQGSLALERSRLFERERRARGQAEAAYRRAAFKADASAALAASLDYETTLANVAKLAVPKFADWCAVELGEGDGVSKLVAVAHVDPSKVQLAWTLRDRYPLNPDAPHGVPQVLRTGVPELIEQIDDELLQQSVRDPEQLALACSLGLRSAITVPMAVRGRTVGAISFAWAESGKHYDRADLETAILIGQRAALAIENAKLHRDLQRAVRARDDLLAVVTHDLRNPLGAVSLKAEALSRALSGEGSPAKARKHTEGIRAAVDRMEELINDLLDLGSIEAGHFRVEPAVNDLASLLSGPIDEMSAFAVKKGVSLRLEPLPEACLLRCDRRRVVQVLANLIGNAIKFTPSDGEIAVQAKLEGGMARVTVRDTGAGIEAVHLAHVFDRYYQAPSGERSGVGLGLFIAKGIVTAHGGRIWAESVPGAGSAFSFTLPLYEGEGAR